MHFDVLCPSGQMGSRLHKPKTHQVVPHLPITNTHHLLFFLYSSTCHGEKIHPAARMYHLETRREVGWGWVHMGWQHFRGAYRVFR